MERSEIRGRPGRRRGSSWIALRSIQATSCCFLLLLSPAPAAADSFQLVIGGTPAVGFVGRCSLVGSPGGSRREISGRIPSSGSFEADAVQCTVRKQDQRGRMNVKLLREDGSTVAAAGTSSPYAAVRVRTDGPWGKAGGLNVR